MKINTHRIPAVQLNKTKGQSIKETFNKESFSTDKIELSAKAKSQLVIHEEKNNVISNIEGKYSDKSISHVKQKIADKQYHVNVDDLATSMMDFMMSIKGE